MLRFYCSALLACTLGLPVLATAQSTLLAGQATGAQQVTLSPARDLAVVGPSTNDSESLDIDQDGQTDLLFLANESTNRFVYVTSQVQTVNPNVEVAKLQIVHYAFAFATNTPIQAIIPPKASSTLAGEWTNRTVTLLETNSVGWQATGEFQYPLMPATNYLGIRLRTGGAWRYGWVRIQMLDHITAHYKIEAFALQDAILPAISPGLAAAWQVYPVPAGEQLTIQPPTEARARATLLDHLGRPVVASVELAAGRATRVPLAGLPAGLYLLRIETPQGSFTRRVEKH